MEDLTEGKRMGILNRLGGPNRMGKGKNGRTYITEWEWKRMGGLNRMGMGMGTMGGPNRMGMGKNRRA